MSFNKMLKKYGLSKKIFSITPEQEENDMHWLEEDVQREFDENQEEINHWKEFDGSVSANELNDQDENDLRERGSNVEDYFEEDQGDDDCPPFLQ